LRLHLTLNSWSSGTAKARVQHRLFVGELKEFKGLKTYPGGWRWYDPDLPLKVNEAKLIVNYEDRIWRAPLEELMKIYPAFKVPASGTLDLIQVAYGYNDLSESDKAELRDEALKSGHVVEKTLEKSMEIDRVTLHYTQDTKKFTIKVLSFNNVGQ